MVKTPYGIINMTSSSGGGGTGPAGEGWVRLLLDSADYTDDTYSRINSVTETPGSTGTTSVNYQVNNASLGVPVTANRYIAGGAIWMWETGLDFSTPKVIELFFEGTGLSSTSNIVLWYGITHAASITLSTIHSDSCAIGYWNSPRSRTGTTDPGGRTMYLVGNIYSPSTGALEPWQNGHHVILQPVGLTQAAFVASIQNNSYDSTLNEWRVGNRGSPPASNTDPLNLFISIGSERVSAAGSTTETFRLWYRITDDYFTWS